MSSYQTRSLERLELSLILERLEAACACELGRARVRALQPTNSNSQARARLALTSEARHFAQSVRHPPFGGLSDVTAPLQAASIGSTVGRGERFWLRSARAAEGARRLRASILSLDIEHRRRRRVSAFD